MTQNVKGFRQAKAPNKKQVQSALDGEIQRLRQNQQMLLQLTQRNMQEVHKLNTQVTGLDSLLGYKSSTDASATDDVVLMSCIGYDPETGLPFAGGRLDFVLVQIGSGKLIPEFEKQLIGLSPSEKVKTIDVKFPEDYGNKELANKIYKFDLIVLEVYRKAVSTANYDARVKELEALQTAKEEAEAKAAKEQSNETKQEAQAEEQQQA